MNIRKLAGASLLGLTALLAGTVSAEASHRHGPNCGHRGYYSSRGYYGGDYRSYGYGGDYRSYGYGYRAPRYDYRSARPYDYGSSYYDDYAYDPYYSAPRAYYGPRYCPPRRRARVGVFFGF